MFRFAATLSLLSLAASLPKQSFSLYRPKSAASAEQIQNAIENNYDDTGPGAKTPQYAYKTYRNLAEALVGYIDDKDTKLPEHERSLALRRLNNDYTKPRSDNDYTKPRSSIVRYQPKTVDEYTGYNEMQKNKIKQKPSYYVPNQFDSLPKDAFILQEIKPAYSYPRLENLKQVAEPKKQYSYSYGVNDASTGDLKSAQEWGGGGAVRGHYALREPDGTMRRVLYRADQDGFRATVIHDPVTQ